MTHPRPHQLFFQQPKPKRPIQRHKMTVCIAAACEGATKVVVATDRLLSYAGVVSENLSGKMLWLGDWLVLYAGLPCNTALIFDTFHDATKEKATTNVQKALRDAYQCRKGLLSSFASLSSYDETLVS
jgi:hypothetical protein